MNRSNVGNITTNAMQTLSISGTTVAGMRRARDRADLALNAQEKQSAMADAKISSLKSKQAKDDANATLTNEKAEQARLKTEQIKLKNEATAARTERTKQLIDKDKRTSIDDIMQDNSEQVPHIKTKINNDIEDSARRMGIYIASPEEVLRFNKLYGGE